MDIAFKAFELVGISLLGGLLSSNLMTKESAEKVSKDYKEHKLINAAISLISSNNITAFCYALTGFGAIMSYRLKQSVDILERERTDLEHQIREGDAYTKIADLVRQNQEQLLMYRQDLRHITSGGNNSSNNNAISNSDNQNQVFVLSGQQQHLVSSPSAAVTSSSLSSSLPPFSYQQQQQQQQIQAALDPRLVAAKERTDNARRDFRIAFFCTMLCGAGSVGMLAYLSGNANRGPVAAEMSTEVTTTPDGTTITKKFPATHDATRVPKHGDPNLADMKIRDDMMKAAKVYFYDHNDGLRAISKESFLLAPGGEVQSHKEYGKAGAQVCLERDGKDVGCKRAYHGAKYNTSDFC